MRGPRKNSPGLKLWRERAAGGGGGRSGNNRERPPFLFPLFTLTHSSLSSFFTVSSLPYLDREPVHRLRLYLKHISKTNILAQWCCFSQLSGGALE